MNLADRIQYLRKSQGISQEELAYKIGVSRQAVSKWESEQSLPDIDRIIAMSEFFQVTTDYLLIGIVTEKKEKKMLSARDWTFIGTALNLVGLLLTCFIWYERQEAYALAIGFSLITLGCLLYTIGVNRANAPEREKAKRIFWSINIWIISFPLLSLVYNFLSIGLLAPYPLLNWYFIFFDPSYIYFWIIYLALCTIVTWLAMKQDSSRIGS